MLADFFISNGKLLQPFDTQTSDCLVIRFHKGFPTFSFPISCNVCMIGLDCPNLSSLDELSHKEAQ